MNQIPGVVYKSKEIDSFDLIASYVTLSSIFFISWSYIILIIGCIFYIYYHQNFIVLFVLTFVFSSIWWAKERWSFIGESYVFKTWRKFFSFTVIKESKLEVNQHYLFAAYPHGLFPMSLPILSGISKKHVFSELIETPFAAIATNLFYTPILSSLCIWLGCIPATFENIERALITKSVVIMPDGIVGTYYSDRNKEVIYLRHRKGFIRTALRTGAPLVPIYNFGHTQMFDVFPKANSFIVKISRRIGFAVVSFFGPFWLLPFVPHRTPITMVVGTPIKVIKHDNPTQEQVDSLHLEFIEKLIDLYNKHKSTHPSYINKDLIIV